MKNQEIKIYSLGCRLNMLEAEKIRQMLSDAGMQRAVVVNTCAVTNEALRQSRQAFHRIARENPDIPIFITGCGATHRPEDFAGAKVIPNKDKFNPAAYGIGGGAEPIIKRYEKMQSKGFVQIGDGCDRHCTYCITRILRGPAAHFSYDRILAAAKSLVDGGYEEIILTGVNIADWQGVSLAAASAEAFGEGRKGGRGDGLLSLCKQLLADLPAMRALTLSSLDPAANIEEILDLIAAEPRMTKHLHLSVQSGSDWILQKMARRHNAARIRNIAGYANKNITFSWDIICGFPGETEALFAETLSLAQELKPIKIHAFPFSARPGTPAAAMPNKVPRAIAKDRVRKITNS